MHIFSAYSASLRFKYVCAAHLRQTSVFCFRAGLRSLFQLSILNKQFHTRGTPTNIGSRIASVHMYTQHTGSHHRIAAHEEDGWQRTVCFADAHLRSQLSNRAGAAEVPKSFGLHNATAVERKQGGKREPTNREHERKGSAKRWQKRWHAHFFLFLSSRFPLNPRPLPFLPSPHPPSPNPYGCTNAFRPCRPLGQPERRHCENPR